MRLRTRTAAVVVAALLAAGSFALFTQARPAAAVQPGGLPFGVKVKSPVRLADGGAVNVPLKVRCQGYERLVVDVAVTQEIGGGVVASGFGTDWPPCEGTQTVVVYTAPDSPGGAGFVRGRANVTATAYACQPTSCDPEPRTDTRTVRVRR